jgi:hypothetical protein
MARKKVATNPTDERDDPFVAWERFRKPRREIDADVSELVAEFQSRIAKRGLVEGLVIATRAARRIRTAPLPMTDVAKVALSSVDRAIWIAEAVTNGREEGPRLEAAERNATARLYEKEWALYVADRVVGQSSSFAILDDARVAARLLECVGQVLKDEVEGFAQRAASVIAHCIKVAEVSRGNEERDQLVGAIRSDLKASRQGRGTSPLWPSGSPAWYDEVEEAKNLSKVGAYVIKEMMAKHEKRQDPQEDILRGAKGPAAKFGPVERVSLAEERFAEVQKQQFEGIQSLLDSLRGVSLGTPDGNKALANRVMRMVHDSGGVLLMSGEFTDGKGRFKIYTDEPVAIRCERSDSSSFHLRTPDGRGYLTALPKWPNLFIVAKDTLSKPPQST